MAEKTEEMGWVLEDQEALGPTEARDAFVTLTQDETIEHARSLADQMGELAELEQEKKAWLDNWKAGMSRLERRIAHNRVAIQKGEELRAVVLQWVFNYHTKTATLLNPDDPENPAESRAMTEDELQQVLFPDRVQGESPPDVPGDSPAKDPAEGKDEEPPEPAEEEEGNAEKTE